MAGIRSAVMSPVYSAMRELREADGENFAPPEAAAIAFSAYSDASRGSSKAFTRDDIFLVASEITVMRGGRVAVGQVRSTRQLGPYIARIPRVKV